MPDFSIPYQKINLHLEEVITISTHNEISKRLKPNLKGMIDWTKIDAPKKKLIEDYSSIPGIQDQVLINCLFVSTIASFESYLRELVIEVLKKIEDSGSIPELLINKNIQLSGIAMSTIYSPVTHLKLDYNNICRKIGTIPSKDPTKINHEIAFFIKNVLQLDNLFLFLKTCQINIEWDDLGRVKPIQRLLNTKSTRETTKTLKSELKKYLDTRNRIAHTGMNSSDITYPELKDSVKLIIILSEFLMQQCE